MRQTKIICSLDLLINVFRKCQHPGCSLETIIKHHLNGPTAIINWACPAGHKGTFTSSKDQNGIYCNNLQVAGSIMLSGNNFAKVEKMADFLGLAFISDSTFYRMQRLYFIPAIEEWWGWQREQLLRDFRGKEVVVCGDGQCDSPGHTAKNLNVCYFLMELVSSYILEIEVRDKRHVGLTSANMERQALQNALQRLQVSLNIVEVVTDASSTIKKLLADNFATVFHSLDVWHKSKSIRKCLAKVAHLHVKGMEKIQAWADHIILHFWHCANICKASEATTDDEALEKMKSTWIGLLHHVCNEHDWSGGSCEHGELEEHDLPWFDRRDKDFEALQKIVLDSQLLSSFKFYVRFRHTGNLECANNLSLVYTPKRCSYSYRSYKARKQLTAIDWNYHLNQAVATTKAGDMIVSRKYNQRTKEWNSRVVKVKKGYEYIPVLMARIMKMRKEDANKVTRNVPLNDSDPALLAPTIAAKPPPSSKELFLLRKSRFEKANPDESSTDDL